MAELQERNSSGMIRSPESPITIDRPKNTNGIITNADGSITIDLAFWNCGTIQDNGTIFLHQDSVDSVEESFSEVVYEVCEETHLSVVTENEAALKECIDESTSVVDVICDESELLVVPNNDGTAGHDPMDEIFDGNVSRDLFEDDELTRSTLLKSYNMGLQVLIRDHTVYRGVLLSMIIVRNGCRSCALSNMTLEELKGVNLATDEEGNTDYVIGVKEHKTVLAHGDAHIAVNKDIYEFLLTYVNYYRAKLTKLNTDPHNYVFVTWNGKKLSSADLYESVQNVWTLAGLKTNILRKASTSRIHIENIASRKEAVAKHLRHNLATAENFYKFKSGPSRSVAAAKIIRTTLGGSWTNAEEVTDSGNETNVDYESEQDLDTIGNEVIINESVRMYPDYNPSPPHSVVQDVDLDSQTEKRGKGRCFYNDDDRKILSLVFAKNIADCIVPKMAEIKKVVKDDFRSSSMRLEKLNPIKIKGALQGLINKEKKKDK